MGKKNKSKILRKLSSRELSSLDFILHTYFTFAQEMNFPNNKLLFFANLLDTLADLIFEYQEEPKKISNHLLILFLAEDIKEQVTLTEKLNSFNFSDLKSLSSKKSYKQSKINKLIANINTLKDDNVCCNKSNSKNAIYTERSIANKYFKFPSKQIHSNVINSFATIEIPFNFTNIKTCNESNSNSNVAHENNSGMATENKALKTNSHKGSEITNNRSSSDCELLNLSSYISNYLLTI